MTSSDDESTNLAEHEGMCEDQFEGGVEEWDEQPSFVDEIHSSEHC